MEVEGCEVSGESRALRWLRGFAVVRIGKVHGFGIRLSLRFDLLYLLYGVRDCRVGLTENTAWHRIGGVLLVGLGRRSPYISQAACLSV